LLGRVGHHLGGGFLVLCLVLTGTNCKKAGESKKFMAFKADLVASLEANNTKLCKRPILRGEVRPGDGGDLLFALFMEPKANQECLSALRSIQPTDLRLGIGIDPVARALDDSIADMPDVRTTERLCLPLVDEVQTLLRHESNCSPFLFGRHGMPDAKWGYRVALFYRAMSLKARRLATEGRMTEAFQVVLDGARFYQDAARGDVDWETASTSIGHWATVLSVVAEMLLNTEDNTPEIAMLLAEIEVLLASEPHPSSHVQGEDFSITIKAVMPAVMGRGWEPLGGWGFGQALTVYNLATKSALVKTWYQTQNSADRLMTACPRGIFWFRCIRDLYKVHESLKDNYLRGETEFVAGDKSSSSLEATLARLRLGVPQHRFLQRRALGPLTLVAMRVHLLFRQLQDGGGPCPSLVAFTEEPLRSAMYAEFFGGRLRVSKRPSGGYVLLPPANFSLTSKPLDDPLWTVICR